MQTMKNEVILLDDDYEVLRGFLGKDKLMTINEKENIKHLFDEVNRARVVSKDEIPANTIRLNSTVVIKDTSNNRVMALTIVLPEQADKRKHKVSVLSPIGTALIGYRKGQQVDLRVSAGRKNFTIMDVYPSRPETAPIHEN
jgi:regulator of nucleoside diphosphate kinase